MVGRKNINNELYGQGLLGEALGGERSGALSEKFTLPPLTVLNAREGYWQERKRMWLGLGIQSELGRGAEEVGATSKPVSLPKSQPISTPVVPAVLAAPPKLRVPPIVTTAVTSKQTAAEEPAEPTTAPVFSPPKVRSAPKPSTTSLTANVEEKPRLLPAKTGFKMPTVTVKGVSQKMPTGPKIPYISPLATQMEKIQMFGDERMTFDEATWEGQAKGAIGLDVESYVNYFAVCFKNFTTGKRLAFERSDRSDLPVEWINKILTEECIITFNGIGYDMNVLWFALKGATTQQLKTLTDKIIIDKLKHWEVEDFLKQTKMANSFRLPSINHVDLSGPNPAVRRGLKEMGAHLHSPLIIDLPYEPHHYLSHDQMNVTTYYCQYNDLDQTQLLFNALKGPLALRVSLGKVYGIDLRSKSDAQAGEAIVKQVIEKTTKRTIKKNTAGNSAYTFPYAAPPFITFSSKQMNDVMTTLAETQFYVNDFGKVLTPSSLKDYKVSMGQSVYSMGIGGLHSTEENRVIASDNDNVLIDMDVASQYPNIIMKLGLYPKAAGKEFLDVIGNMIKERLAGKDKIQEFNALAKTRDLTPEETEEKAKIQIMVEGFKIALNGVYGKLGSEYSYLYAPNIMIAVTITGQLSLLMLIERCEAAGIPIVSGNTDGVVARCPKGKQDKLKEIVQQWETDTGFVVESARYKKLYTSSVNTYIAIKEDGKFKLKGPHANPWAENDMRGQLSKNPQMTVRTNAILEYIKYGTPFEQFIRAQKDPRDFVTSILSNAGTKWRGEPLGRVLRYYWSTDGDAATTPDGKRKIANTDGSRPMMQLPETLPADIDYKRYVDATDKLARELAVITEEGLMK